MPHPFHNSGAAPKRTLETLERCGHVYYHRPTCIDTVLGGRLIVTINDSAGRPVALAGRTLDGGRIKWKTSRAHEAFDRNRTLFNLDRALGKMEEGHTLLIVEGYFDAIALHVWGFAAVATMGSVMHPEQARLIARVTRNVVLLPDNDEAGQSGAATARELLRARGVKSKVIQLETDPDEWLKVNRLAGSMDLLCRVRGEAGPTLGG